VLAGKWPAGGVVVYQGMCDLLDCQRWPAHNKTTLENEGSHVYVSGCSSHIW
jgi:hypothetical protein